MTNLKLFVVRKYVMATTAADAIKREKHQSVDDVWMDEDWRKKELEHPKSEIPKVKSLGFSK